jgi:hypothetical protein
LNTLLLELKARDLTAYTYEEEHEWDEHNQTWLQLCRP